MKIYSPIALAGVAALALAFCQPAEALLIVSEDFLENLPDGELAPRGGRAVSEDVAFGTSYFGAGRLDGALLCDDGGYRGAVGPTQGVYGRPEAVSTATGRIPALTPGPTRSGDLDIGDEAFQAALRIGTSPEGAVPVPEPSTILIWSILGLGVGLGMAQRRRRAARLRMPWSSDKREAIMGIIERGRHAPPRSDWTQFDSPW